MSKNNNKSLVRRQQPQAKRSAPPKVIYQKRNVMARPELPMCAKEYARALLDPWTAPPACYPDGDAKPSFKARGRLRGTLSIGTQGVGFVVLSQSPFNNNTQVCYSDATYAGTSITTNNPTTGVNFASASYPIDSTSGNVEGRIVATGLRVSYTGTELNRGGTIYATSGTGDGSIDLNGFTTTTLGADEQVSICYPNAERDWVGIVSRVPNVSRKWSAAADTVTVRFSSGFLIIGTPGETYSYDFAGLAEYVSNKNGAILPGISPSYSAVGESKAIESAVANTKGTILKAGTEKASFLDRADHAIENVGNVLGVIGSVVKTGINVGKMIGFL